MGEVVLSCEDGVEMVVEKNEEIENEEKRGNKEGSSSMVKWERFLPRVSLRVLLVEADDSTRQIIGALLRKCSYKVASVSDGLKAWEVLKARPHNIDLILTEIELPSISGYALLTLIMEHEICKNVPVIMMSTHDSVSTVYKCMLRGAADFLVKPIRTNELKNLWQHVWRRQSMSRPGVGPQAESVAQEKLEATAENNATSDHSSSSKSCAPRQDNCIEKGSDAQSSCVKADLEAEGGYMTDAENQSQAKPMKSPVSDLQTQEHLNYAKSDQNLRGLEIVLAESHTAAGNDNHALVQDGRLEQHSGENVNLYAEASNNRDVITHSSSKAVDLIGALRDHPRPNSCVNNVANKFESSPKLDLSLRRFNLGIFEHKAIYEKQMLHHSNASAFTRYVNKAMCSSDANATSVSTPKGGRVNAGDNFSDNSPGSNTNPKNSSIPHYKKMISLPSNLTKEAENEYPTASQRLLPIPFPARGIRVDVCTPPVGYRSTIPPAVRTPSPLPGPSSTNQQHNSFPQLSVDVVNGRHHYQSFDPSPRISSNQPISKQDQVESLGDRTQLSPATDQSASSTLNNETANPNVFGCAGNVHQDATVPGSSNSGNEPSHASNHELNRQRSIQREAALTKFRLKRKERCFEKKVRYESRRKLAEQRPRVKGQFVRQVPPDPPPKSSNSGGTSISN